MKKVLSTIGVLSVPAIVYAEEISKRTFFIGRSFYFWLLIALGFYLFYLYKTSKNQQSFLKSSLTRTIGFAITIFFASFLFVNLLLKDPLKKESSKDASTPVQELLELDEKYAKDVETDFINAEKHYRYLTHHFRIPKYWKKNDKYYERDDYTIANLYYDRLSFHDSLYVNYGRLGLGIYHYKRDSLDLALRYLSNIKPDTLPLLNAYKGKIFLVKGRTEDAITELRKAVEKKDAQYEASMRLLVSSLEKTNKNQELLALLYNPSTNTFVPSNLASKLYFLDNNLHKYYTHLLKTKFEEFKVTGLIAALGILLVWLVYIVGIDIFERENIIHVLLTLIGGMFFSFLTFYLSDLLKFKLDFTFQGGYWDLLVYSVFGIGFIEELVKIIPLLILLLIAPKVVNEPYDYILYASVSALGFAFIENLFYFQSSLSGIVQGRGMTSVPGHMIDSSIVAYGFVLARYRYKNFPSVVAFFVFLLLGAINHGLYDYFLFIKLQPLFLFCFLLSVSLWIIIINNCLNNSPSFSYLTKFHSSKLQLFIAFSLLSIMVLEYVVVAWEKGPSMANASFNSSLVLGGIFIVYYADRLTSMDLVKGYWASIPLRTIYEKQEGEKFDLKHFFLRIIAGDTMPHAFVGKKIRLIHDANNKAFSRYFSGSVKAEITDRLIVNCLSKRTKEKYADPYWFILKTQIPIYTGPGHTEQEFLLKFESIRPSFRKQKYLTVYLYAVKTEPVYGEEFVDKSNLRAFGTAIVSDL